MDEDIPLPVDLPAAAVKWAYCPVSWQQMAGFHMGTAGRARQKIHPTEAIPTGTRTAGMGHKGRFRRLRPNGRCGFCEGTSAGTRGNGRDPPIPDARRVRPPGPG